MGWASGSSMFGEIIEFLQETIEDEDVRKEIYLGLIDIFENRDCDTLDECKGEDEAFDEAFEELHPSDEDEEDLDSWGAIDETAFEDED